MAGNFWQSSHYQQWVLDKQDILLARSQDLKIYSEDEYEKLMVFFANLIQALGESLKVRQQVIATATVYFKRFYSRVPLKSIDPFLLCPACIFLASKVEEFGLLSNTKIVTNMQGVLKNKYAYLQHEFVYSTRNVYEAEFFLLELMDCCLIVYHPYRALVQFHGDLDDALVSLTWKIINDSLRTDACIMYAPYQIGLAALHIASVSLDRDLNEWFAELCVDMELILQIIHLILHMYEVWKNFDEKKELSPLILKLPRPVVASPTQSMRQSPVETKHQPGSSHQHMPMQGVQQQQRGPPLQSPNMSQHEWRAMCGPQYRKALGLED